RSRTSAAGGPSRTRSSTRRTASSPRSRCRWECRPIQARAAALRIPVRRAPSGGASFGGGFVIGYLSFIVLIPLAAVVWKSTGSGLEGFWNAVTSPAAVASLKLTFGASIVVALVNAVMGTLIAWVLVRDD